MEGLLAVGAGVSSSSPGVGHRYHNKFTMDLHHASGLEVDCRDSALLPRHSDCEALAGIKASSCYSAVFSAFSLDDVIVIFSGNTLSSSTSLTVVGSRRPSGR